MSAVAVTETVRGHLKPVDPEASVTGADALKALQDYGALVIARVKEVAEVFKTDGTENDVVKAIDPTRAKSFNMVVRDTLTITSLNYVLYGAFKRPTALDEGDVAAATDERMRKAGFAVSGAPNANVPEIAKMAAGRLALAEGFDPDKDPEDS